MSYTISYNLAQDDTFKGKVAVAMLTAAKDVLAEVKPNPITLLWQKRQNCAINTLNNQPVQQWANVVVTNVVITDASADSDIQFTVNSIFNHMAGVMDGDGLIIIST